MTGVYTSKYILAGRLPRSVLPMRMSLGDFWVGETRAPRDDVIGTVAIENRGTLFSTASVSGRSAAPILRPL